MPLIPKYHTIADSYPVAAGQEIIEGMFVTLNSNGEVVLASGAANEYAHGIAGDTKSTSVSGLPATNDAEIGVTPTDTQFVNRVSDLYDETKASGKMTVYHSAGVFATNEFVAGAYTVNCPLYVAGGGNSGMLTVTPSTSGQIVARCTKVPALFDSGVPGTDLANGSMALMGQYMEIRLVNG
jgi:hypothetical protein